jgi:hypothetical protein
MGWAFKDQEVADVTHHEAELGDVRLHYMTAGYRALDRDIRENPKLDMPVLALGGACSWGRRLEVVESLRRVARHV